VLLIVYWNFNPWKIPDYRHTWMRNVREHIPRKRFKSSMTGRRTRYCPVKIVSIILRCHYLTVNGSKCSRLFCIAIVSGCYTFPWIRLLVRYQPIFHILDIINLLMIIFESCCSWIFIVWIGIFIEPILHFYCWSLS
jgi:hypothetical protein